MMNSIILRTATKLLFGLLLIFSVFLFLRGHNEPGGGFIGGLVGATSFALFAIAYGPAKSREILKLDPQVLIGLGILFAAISGIISILLGTPFMTGAWVMPEVGGSVLHLGTPIIFDIGVYLVVVGFTLGVIFSLEEEK
ncbi:MAG: multicomponent Na+:H+ antiporter subunit MnhB [Bacteroidetes bacterium HLUCCA01]|nr:MAG: multicomponent Na+:H+ antiporter subunit MnhB [Bacteroidetes bacterium HLUCCA01]